jgi:hypothetical protein
VPVGRVGPSARKNGIAVRLARVKPAVLDVLAHDCRLASDRPGHIHDDVK